MSSSVEKEELQFPQKVDIAEGTTHDIYIDPIKESKMMRKFDLFAVGMLGIFYFFANLDRGNLGNAQVAGMPTDLKLVGNQFGTATTLLFATYVPFETPVALLVKFISPKYILSLAASAWALTCLCMGFLHNYQGLYAARMLIGFFEAGLIPCINVYIGLVYKRSERGKRSSIIFAFSAAASAFGGLLAYGLTQINGKGEYAKGWRILFYVEGALTLLFVPVFFLLFPKTPTTAWFLSAEEKEMMRMRYEQDPSWGYDDKFKWTDIVHVLQDPKFYLFVIWQFSCDISLYGFTTFLPAILKGLGYTSYHANLFTVPVYVFGLLCFLLIAYISDRIGRRGYCLIPPVLALIVGYVILIKVDSYGVRYFACFLVALGIYPTTGLSIMWLNDNVSRHYKRAAMAGMVLTCANTAGVAVGQIFTTATSPRYFKGLEISLGLACLALCANITMIVGMKTVNKRRDKMLQEAEAAGRPIPPQPELGDYDPHFRYHI